MEIGSSVAPISIYKLKYLIAAKDDSPFLRVWFWQANGFFG